MRDSQASGLTDIGSERIGDAVRDVVRAVRTFAERARHEVMSRGSQLLPSDRGLVQRATGDDHPSAASRTVEGTWSTDSPAVSVVVPHYGEVEPTMSVVRDLMAQEGVDSFEIIVSDDCSPQTFPEGEGWKVVHGAANGGYGAACNRGAAAANGEYVLFLNSDVTIGYDFLRRFLEAAKPWGRAITAPAVRQGDHAAPVARFWGKPHQYIVNWATPGARFHGQEWFDRLQGQDVTSMNRAMESGFGVVVDWVSGIAHMMPLEDFRAVGGFDEDYFMYCEEMDLHRRLHGERGLKAVYLPQVEIGHVGGGSSSAERVRSWNVDGQFRFFDKWGGARRFLAGMVATSVLNAGWNTFKKARGADVAPAGTLADEWSTIMHGWRHRKDSGAQRRPVRSLSRPEDLLPDCRSLLIVEMRAGDANRDASALAGRDGAQVWTVGVGPNDHRPESLAHEVFTWQDAHPDGVVVLPAGARARPDKGRDLRCPRFSENSRLVTVDPDHAAVRDEVLTVLSHLRPSVVVLYEETPFRQSGHPEWRTIVHASSCADDRGIVRCAVTCGNSDELYWLLTSTDADDSGHRLW